MRVLEKTLKTLADSDHYLFMADDFYAVFPNMTIEVMRVFLGRAVKAGILERVCRSLYLYPDADFDRSLVLYHAAARLRANQFCYLSLESILSESGSISQIPLGWLTLMTSGRSGIFDCGRWGSIEFIHTEKTSRQVAPQLIFDSRYRLWKANVELALSDMRATRRSLDLLESKRFLSAFTRTGRFVNK